MRVYFTLDDGGNAITCGSCGETSWDRAEVEARVCTACNTSHEEEMAKDRFARRVLTTMQESLEGTPIFRVGVWEVP